MPTHAEIATHTGLTTEQVTAALTISTEMTAETAACTQYGISVGDRVSLAVSSEPDDVTGTVKRLYYDAIGTLVADVELRDGEIFVQNVEFLTRVVGSDTPTYAQTVTALAREYHGSAVDGEVPPSVHFRITTELHAAAARVGIDADTANEDLAEEVQAAFVEAA